MNVAHTIIHNLDSSHLDWCRVADADAVAVTVTVVAICYCYHCHCVAVAVVVAVAAIVTLPSLILSRTFTIVLCSAFALCVRLCVCV